MLFWDKLEKKVKPLLFLLAKGGMTGMEQKLGLSIHNYMFLLKYVLG